MTDAKTYTGRRIEVSPLGQQPIDFGESHLTIEPVTIDGQTRVRVSVGKAAARHFVVLNPADMADIADTCIDIFNAELEKREIGVRLSVHSVKA